MDLSVIRSRLNTSSSAHYGSSEEFVSDVLLMFKNCAKFNYVSGSLTDSSCAVGVCILVLLRFHFLCDNNTLKITPARPNSPRLTV